MAIVNAPATKRDCEEQMLSVRADMLDAEEHGHTLEADLDLAKLNALLDVYPTLPTQRRS